MIYCIIHLVVRNYHIKKFKVGKIKLNYYTKIKKIWHFTTIPTVFMSNTSFVKKKHIVFLILRPIEYLLKF